MQPLMDCNTRGNVKWMKNTGEHDKMHYEAFFFQKKTSLVTEYAWEMSYICWWERWVNFDWLSGLSMEAANGFLPCWWPFVRLVFSGEWHQLCNARKLVAGSTVKLGVREEANNKVLYLCPPPLLVLRSTMPSNYTHRC